MIKYLDKGGTTESSVDASKSTSAAEGFMNSNAFGAIATGVGGIASSFPTPRADLNSNNQMAAEIRDGVSNALLSSGNPYAMAAGAAVKIIDKTGGFSDLSKGLGTGNDVANGLAMALLPGAGWFTPPTEEYEMSNEMKVMGDSYASAMKENQKAAGNAGAKILFGRNLADSNTHVAKNKDAMISNIKESTDADYQAAASMTQNKAIEGQQALQGGYNQALARAGKFGMKIERAMKTAMLRPKPVDNITAYRMGGLITPVEDSFVVTSEEQNKAFFDSLIFNDIPTFKKGGITDKKDKTTNKQSVEYENWVSTVNKDYINDNYDLKTAFETLPRETLDAWKLAVNSLDPEYFLNMKDANGNYLYHLPSVTKLSNGDYKFLKLGKEESNPELHFETDTYYNGSNGLNKTHDLVFNNDENRYYYKTKTADQKEQLLRKLGNDVVVAAGMEDMPEFKEGGQMNVIPEGNLHARLHHMEDSENLTQKGIPVVDNEGNQQAEIELNEIIFNLEVTKKLEELEKKFRSEDTSAAEKDKLAIEAGKLLTCEIMTNTEDRTGLIQTIE